jgi:hypothetical protein
VLVGMLEAEVYKGIEFIRISELSLDQQKAIKSWASADTIIKILHESVLLTDCVLYNNYSFWLNNVYTEVNLPVEVSRNTSSQKIKPIGLALDN